MQLYLGLMSGTSMDGVDAAIVDLAKQQFIAGVTLPYSAPTRNLLQAVSQGAQTDYIVLNQLGTLIGRDFAATAQQLLRESGIAKDEIIAIGSHGQTVCHNPLADPPYTIQLGCPHTIAELTGITVVADFRTRDLITGGQGAPFAPLYHQELFKHWQTAVAVVNIGGIANVSFLAPQQKVTGYDVGPGNCLLDTWSTIHLNQPFDRDGKWAQEGKVIDRLLTQLLADPFFKLPAPKSIGKEYFNLAWLQQKGVDAYQPQDVQATLSAFTARVITKAIIQGSPQVAQVILCGGGVYNKTLCGAIHAELPGIKVQSSSEHGIAPDYLEAMMMAWLAEKTINKTPLDLAPITGARKSAILGAIYAPGMF